MPKGVSLEQMQEVLSASPLGGNSDGLLRGEEGRIVGAMEGKVANEKDAWASKIPAEVDVPAITGMVSSRGSVAIAVVVRVTSRRVIANNIVKSNRVQV